MRKHASHEQFMSDTPRTDALAASPIGFYSCATVPADFARMLEEEVISLIAQKDMLQDKVHELESDVSRLEDFMDTLSNRLERT